MHGMGDEDAAEALSATGRLEGRVGETLRGEPPDDPRMGGTCRQGVGDTPPRPAVPHKLAPYTGVVEARLEEFPGLSAERLFDEVRAAGYPGGYSRVRDYVRAQAYAGEKSISFDRAMKLNNRSI